MTNITTHYLRSLIASILICVTIVFFFISIINPYGVSAIDLQLPGLNTSKPHRTNIDRVIKPFEVAVHRPRTVFMGTSRIHQSIDPSILDDTKYAPAYNASIPASTLSENADYLDGFFAVDPNLRYVFIELFIYNFTHDQAARSTNPISGLLTDSISLLFSADALTASLQTISANAMGKRGAEVKPLGYLIHGPGFDTATTFSDRLFIDAIMDIHKKIPKFTIRPSAISALDRIVETCKRHNAELILLITPNYPWDDYRLRSLGYWTMVEDWTRLMASYGNVYSFAAYNKFAEEKPGSGMQFWYDPIHFSLSYGNIMMGAFLGSSRSYNPTNVVKPVNLGTVEDVLDERRSGLEAWITHNRPFVELFERRKAEAGNLARGK